MLGIRDESVWTPRRMIANCLSEAPKTSGDVNNETLDSVRRLGAHQLRHERTTNPMTLVFLGRRQAMKTDDVAQTHAQSGRDGLTIVFSYP
jgi:hypothetical protein